MSSSNAYLKQLPPTASEQLVSDVEALVTTVAPPNWDALWTTYQATKLKAAQHTPPLDLAEFVNEKIFFEFVNDYNVLKPSRDVKTSLNKLHIGRWKLQASDVLASFHPRVLKSARFLENLVSLALEQPSLDFDQAVTRIKARKLEKSKAKHLDLSSLKPKDVLRAMTDIESEQSNMEGDDNDDDDLSWTGDDHVTGSPTRQEIIFGEQSYDSSNVPSMSPVASSAPQLAFLDTAMKMRSTPHHLLPPTPITIGTKRKRLFEVEETPVLKMGKYEVASMITPDTNHRREQRMSLTSSQLPEGQNNKQLDTPYQSVFTPTKTDRIHPLASAMPADESIPEAGPPPGTGARHAATQTSGATTTDSTAAVSVGLGTVNDSTDISATDTTTTSGGLCANSVRWQSGCKLDDTAIWDVLNFFDIPTIQCLHITAPESGDWSQWQLSHKLKLKSGCSQLLAIIFQPTNHWITLSVDFVRKRTTLYDSAHRHLVESVERISMAVLHAAGSKWTPDWRASYPLTQPLQNNGIDCGVYVLINALNFTVGKQAPSDCRALVWRAVLMLMHQGPESPVEHYSDFSDVLRLLNITIPITVLDVEDCITTLSLFQSEAAFQTRQAIEQTRSKIQACRQEQREAITRAKCEETRLREQHLQQHLTGLEERCLSNVTRYSMIRDRVLYPLVRYRRTLLRRLGIRR